MFLCRAATKLLIDVRLGGLLCRSLSILKPAKDRAARYHPNFQHLRGNCVQADLLASAANSFVSPRTEECLAVVGDCIAKEVSLVSAKQVCFPDFCWHTFCLRVEIILLPLKVVVGRTGLPVARSPLVATLIESLVDPCHVAILSNMDWIPSSLKT